MRVLLSYTTVPHRYTLLVVVFEGGVGGGGGGGSNVRRGGKGGRQQQNAGRIRLAESVPNCICMWIHPTGVYGVPDPV